MEKELNQTTENQAVETKQEKTEKVDIAEIRQKIEERYNTKFTKAQAEFAAQLEQANKELEFYKNELPKLQAAFVKNGGNRDNFNDWLEIHKNRIDYQDLDKSIKASFESSKWAKAENNFSVNQKLNQNIKETRWIDMDDFEPGTAYRKMK